MELTKLNESEFEAFSNNHPYGSFHQTVSWGKLKETNGWKYYLVGIKEKDDIKAATLILEKKLFLNKTILYSPRGFLIDYNNKDLLKLFTNEIKKFAKKKHAIFVKIDPYVIYKERDIDGNYIPNGIDNSKVVDNLKQLKYKHHGFNVYVEDLQPRFAFALNLENKTIDDVMNNMEPKTRQLIRKNIKNCIKARELSLNELNIFTDIMKHTSKRRGFIDRPYSYYEKMLETFKDKAKVTISELHVKEYIDFISKEIKENKKLIIDYTNEIENNPKISIEKTNRKIKELEETNIRLSKKLDEAIEINKDGDIIVLGGIIFLLHGSEVLSLYGGAYEKYMDFLSPYTTNYEMIKYAVENKYKKYNFYGITGDFKNKDKEMYGLYDFKRGFGGQVEEYIGEFDLIVSHFWNRVYRIVFNIYHKIKNIRK